jgi:hypothetical protein
MDREKTHKSLTVLRSDWRLGEFVTAGSWEIPTEYEEVLAQVPHLEDACQT